MGEKELLQKIASLSEQAKKVGFELDYSLIGKDLYLLSNSGKLLNAAVIGFAEINGTNVFLSYLINLKKWKWADAEGFTKEDIMHNPILKEEIFDFVEIDNLINKLS